jgi:hypothetical protein
MVHSEKDVRVEVLGPAQLVVGGKVVPVEGLRLTRLLTRLALGPPEGVAEEILISAIWSGERPPRQPEVALQKLASRLRALGLEDRLVPRVIPYRLDLTDDRIDVRRLTATAAALDAANPADRPDSDTLRGALALWRSDPAEANELDGRLARAARAARTRLESELQRRTKYRVLIIDDKVGHKIKSVLGDYECTVLTDIHEFWKIADRCEDLFDCALVDLHLTRDDCGSEGLAIVDALRQRSTLKAVLMSYQPPEGGWNALVERYNLVDFYRKTSNSEDGRFVGLREMVEQMVGGADVEETLVDRIKHELVRYERKARQQIRLTGGGDVRLAAMTGDATGVREVVYGNGGLAAARAAMAEFKRKWLPDDR